MDIRTLTLIHKLLTAEYDAAQIEHDIAHNAYLIAKRERDRGERDEIPAEIDAAYRAAAKRAEAKRSYPTRVRIADYAFRLHL